MSKPIDIVDIKRAVEDNEIMFFVYNDDIYCQFVPNNGEIVRVGTVVNEDDQEVS